MRIIGRILSKFLIGASNQKLCKINVITDVGWKYGCICTGEIVQDLEVGMWIEGVGCYQRFSFDDEWKMIEIDIIEEPLLQSKIHSYLNLARYFLSYEQSTQTLFQSKDIGQTHEICESQFLSSHSLDTSEQSVWKGLLLYQFPEGYAPILVQPSENLIANWSISPKIQSVLDEEVLCILQQFIRDGDIKSLLESIQPYCIDRDFSSSRVGIYIQSMFFLPPIQGYRNVLADLDELLHKSKKELKLSSLGIFLSGCTKIPPQKPAFVIPLNTDQYEAVSQAMCQKWTTITGPPGTGKTQVLINTIVSCLLRGERICIVAKNNQALDLIFDRIQHLHKNSLAMRTGNASIRDQIIEKLEAFFPIPPKPPKEETEIEMGFEDMQQLDIRQRQLPIDEEWLKEFKLAIQNKLKEVGAPLFDNHQELLEWLALGQKEQFDDFIEKKEIIVPSENIQQFIVKDHQKFRYLKLYRKIRSIEKLQEQRLKENEIRASLQEAWIELCHQRMDVFWDQVRYDITGKGLQILSEYQQALKRKKGHKEKFPEILEFLPLWGVTTLSARTTFPLIRNIFDVVIVDEASQADIPSFLPMIYRSKRIVVIGDPHQLPPIVSMSEQTEERIHQDLNVHLPKQLHFTNHNSLFSISDYLSKSLFLSYHYRCPPIIGTLVSRLFYNNKLLPQREDKAPDALCWISINGQAKVAEQGSICNEMEALQIVKTIMKYRLNWENQEFNIGVISPFRGQVQLIQSLLKKKCPHVQILVDTAHRFQGDERDIILMSLVVTPHSSKRQFEFAMDAQLMNVSLTRAKQKLWIYSHPQNPNKNQMLREIFQTSSKINTNFEAIDTPHPHE